MVYRGLLGAATIAFLLSGQGVFAQTNAVPAEFPPASFTGNQFVDSKGCAFIRAGIGGAVSWVPRVDRRRNQLCSFQATFGRAAPAPVAAPAPRRAVGAPIRTVASLTTAPGLVQIPTATTATARSPQIVRDAPRRAPVIVAPAPASPPPAPRQSVAAFCTGRTGLQAGFLNSSTGGTIDCGGTTAPAQTARATPTPAPRQTVAAFCTDRTGLQAGFISSSTGDTIDCGGRAAPVPVTRTVARTVPAAPAPRQTKAAFCTGRSGPQSGFISSTTGQTIDCGGNVPDVRTASAAQPLRMTMDQVCADIRTTGRNFVNAQTGLPVLCAPQTKSLAAVTARGPSVLSGPATPLAPNTGVQASCPSAILTVNGQQVQCSTQAQSVITRTSTFDASGQVTRSSVSTSMAPLFGPVPVPASNPRGVSHRQVLPVPTGYIRVWGDGRHNPNRGLPQARATQVTPALKTRAAPRNVSTGHGHRYVQVGVFANAGNAQSLGQRFMGMGLPVGVGTSSVGKVVVLGPFRDTKALNRGLSAARNAGFSSAYTRN